MSDKFRNKYRIPPARAQWWDYGDAAAYFVTVCTAGMHCYFGKVAGGKTELSEIGKIAEDEWQKTFTIRPDMNLEQGAFVIMPNHFHAIIIIGNNEYNSNDIFIQRPQGNAFGQQSKNLAAIIRGFKGTVTKKVKQFNPDFEWQPSFHEHIIRNGESYDNITNYIITNPEKWEDDRFYSP